MTITLREVFDDQAQRWFGKPYEQVDKREFALKWFEDFQERHKDWTEEDWKEYENR